MARRLLGLVLVLSLSSACHEVMDLGVRTVSDPRLRETLYSQETFEIVVEPQPPQSLELGDSSHFRVKALLKSGELCLYCEASWSSSAPEVAAFSEPEPRCSGGRCALLQTMSPGMATLSVEVCRTYERQCLRSKFEVRVKAPKPEPCR